MTWRQYFSEKLKNSREMAREDFLLRPKKAGKSFSRAIFSVSPETWALGPSSSLPTEERASEGQQEPSSVSQQSEREQTLKSLREFAERSIQSSGGEKSTSSLRFQGGELQLKDGANNKDKLEIHLTNSDAPSNSFFGETAEGGEGKAPLVAFVGETQEEEQDDLLGKMIGAMKLGEGEFLRSSRLREEQKKAMAFELLDLKPQVLITLGAPDTHLFLNAKERLSRVHGKFYDLTISAENDEWTLKLVPIFHPDFLRINPNMKKSAWSDLQKIMRYIGKL